MEVAFVLVLGIGYEEEHLTAVGQAGTETESFVIGKAATGKVDGGAEFGKQLLFQFITGLMGCGINQIETDTDTGADATGGFLHLALEDDELPVVEGCQTADAKGAFPLGTLGTEGIGDVPILMEGLQVVGKTLQPQTVGKFALDVWFRSVSLQRILGSGPKQVGSGIIGESLKTAVAVNTGKDFGDVEPSSGELSVEGVFNDLSVALATDEYGVGVGNRADALFVAVGLMAGNEAVGTNRQDVARQRINLYG